MLVTWRMHKGTRHAACVQCFFDMIQLLEVRQDDYLRQYDAIPRLRAGIHGGAVVTTWVGEARKDLAFHGDTMNTAARVETACKELNAQCLVSELVYDAIELPPHLEARSVGEGGAQGTDGRATPILCGAGLTRQARSIYGKMPVREDEAGERYFYWTVHPEPTASASP